jgi:hypothetical protein
MKGNTSESEISSPRATGWIFPWRRSFRRRWSLLVAVLVVLPILAIFVSTVRVRVFFQPPALNRSAELVLISDTQENRIWMEKMAQKTPFPVTGVKQDGEQWTDQQLRAERYVRYQPVHELRDVALPQSKTVFDQSYWLPPLPQAEELTVAAQIPQGKQLKPRVRWLSALKSSESPSEWPNYLGPAGVATGAKYMLEVDAEGRVVNCFALLRESDAADKSIENWLRRLAFTPSTPPRGWLAAEIFWEYDHD